MKKGLHNRVFIYAIILASGCATHTSEKYLVRDLASLRAERSPPKLGDLTTEQLAMAKSVINSFADLFTALDENYQAGRNGALNLGLNESPLFEKIKPLLKECEDITQKDFEAEDYARPGNRTWIAGFEGKKCPFRLKTELTVVTDSELDTKVLNNLAPHGSFMAAAKAVLTIDSKELKELIGVSSVNLKGSAISNHTGTEAQGKSDFRAEVLTSSYGKVALRGDFSGTLARAKRPVWGEDWKIPSQGTATGTITMEFLEKGFAAQFKVMATPNDDGEAGKITEQGYAKQFRYFINEKEVKRSDFVALLKPEHGGHIENNWPHGEVRKVMKHALNPWIHMQE